MDYVGTLFRALNPIWARSPLSGEGAAQFGGRFNPKGMAALYTSLKPETAMREANQVGAFQPITLVAYHAEIRNIFNATDPKNLASVAMTPSQIGDPAWRDVMLSGGIAPTQRLALDLAAQGYAGILVPSFAPHTPLGSENLVLWQWGNEPPALLRLIDDQGRLSH